MEAGKLYDAHYFRHGCGRPYQRDAEWLQFFDRIAERIIQTIAPRTVLDVGCAMGFLVEALRRRGVEAYGLDISEYAISQVHPDIRPYCWVGSATEPLPQRYDLIVCLEVLEHLPPAETEQAVANLCHHTDDLLFSSTPLDYQEPTHFNVQPPEYWTELFARYGFIRDVAYDTTWLTPWARRFRRTREPLSRLVAAYEARLWRLEAENWALRSALLQNREAMARLEGENQALQTEVAQLRAQMQALRRSLTWRATEPIRRVWAVVRRPGQGRDTG